MPGISLTSEPRTTAEFASLFDRLVSSRRPRSRRPPTDDDSDHTDSEADDAPAPVPQDLVPVVRNLARLLSNTDAPPPPPPPLSPRSHPNDDSAAKSIHLNDTDVGPRYPFTFKLMLHQLYEIEEWAKMVHDVVENSRVQFKPLAEQQHQPHRKEGGPIKRDPDAAHCNNDADGDVSGMLAKMTIRPRAKSHAATTTTTPNANAKDAAMLRPSGALTPNASRRESRALKKRCVGRRRSFGVSLTEGWVYDAAISCVENRPSGESPRARARVRSLEGVATSGLRIVVSEGDCFPPTAQCTDDVRPKRRVKSLIGSSPL
jgi:hypothetical protein